MDIPTKAIKAVIVQNEKILLLQRNKALRGIDNWDLPGGLVEPGESEEETLMREVQEELQLKIKIVRASKQWKFFRPKDEQWVNVQNYICEIVSGELRLSEEHSAYRWIVPEEIKSFAVKDESLYDAILNEIL